MVLARERLGSKAIPRFVDHRAIGTLCGAATHNAAQDWIDKWGRQRLTVGQQCRFRQNRLEVRKAITFVRPVNISSVLPCHIAKDLIEIDLSLRGWNGRERLKSGCARPEPIHMPMAIAIESFVTMTQPPWC